MSRPHSGELLLDVNILLALAMPGHSHHQKVFRWFRDIGSHAFSTCAFTQSGFVRIVSNAAIYTERVSHEGALKSLKNLTSRKEHRFWPISIGYLEAVQPLRSRISGYKQISDAYLLGLAIHHHGTLVTMDKGIAVVAGSEFAGQLEIID